MSFHLNCLHFKAAHGLGAAAVFFSHVFSKKKEPLETYSMMHVNRNITRAESQSSILFRSDWLALESGDLYQQCYFLREV